MREEPNISRRRRHAYTNTLLVVAVVILIVVAVVAASSIILYQQSLVSSNSNNSNSGSSSNGGSANKTVTTVITTSTMTVASTTIFETSTRTTTVAANVPDEGYISFLNMGYFAYKRVALGEGESITFKGVTFTNLRLNTTYTGCSVSFIKTSFQDKVSEVKQITICPTLFEPHLYFTNHTSPKAGVIISFGHSPIIQGTYILVED